MKKPKDITGNKYNMLTAVRYAYNKNRNIYWIFKCDCGKETTTQKQRVVSGFNKSCGCLSSNNRFIKTHGMTKTDFYHRYTSILDRCLNKKNNYFNHYGARGIKCLWKTFEEFRDDMYESYLLHCKEYGKKNTSIDRIDNNGNYCKENCKWSTKKEQSRNTRRNHFLIFNGKRLTVSEWAEIIGVERNTIYERINHFGWSIKKTLTTLT